VVLRDCRGSAGGVNQADVQQLLNKNVLKCLQMSFKSMFIIIVIIILVSISTKFSNMQKEYKAAKNLKLHLFKIEIL